MSLSNILALFSTMFVLAIIPGPSVFAVVARSIASGFVHGAVTAMGIVVGDFIFILLAILGLWTIAEAIDSVFFLVKYFGGAYLIYLGIVTWRTNPRHKAIESDVEAVKEITWLSDFMCGLLITLSDPKAILFYAGFLPAYLNLSSLSVDKAAVILLNAVLAVGSAKLIYVYLADRAKFLFSSTQVHRMINRLAGIAMIGTGVFLVIKI